MNPQSNLAGIPIFKSRVAAKLLQISCLGFLGGLGFVPGWERLLGFTGFFGFAGVSCVVELIHRARHRTG